VPRFAPKRNGENYLSASNRRTAGSQLLEPEEVRIGKFGILEAVEKP
jgi:hypothetical protein